MLQTIGTGAAALAAPFLFIANAGALADECKKAPAPLDSNRSALIDLSRRTSVLIADASPAVAQAQQTNCLPPRSALDAIRHQGQIIRAGQNGLTDKFNRLPTPPGG
jgi:hypothetical protein